MQAKPYYYMGYRRRFITHKLQSLTCIPRNEGESDTITAVPLQEYVFSAWGKTLNAGGASYPAVRGVEFNGNKNWIRKTNLYFNRGTNNWTNKQTVFQTAINTKYLYVYTNIWNVYGTFWVDYMVLSVSTP